MVVGYRDGSAAASLTQFLGPTGAGSLAAILYTTTCLPIYMYRSMYTHARTRTLLLLLLQLVTTIREYKNQSDHTRFSRYRAFRLLRRLNFRNVIVNIIRPVCARRTDGISEARASTEILWAPTGTKYLRFVWCVRCGRFFRYQLIIINNDVTRVLCPTNFRLPTRCQYSG